MTNSVLRPIGFTANAILTTLLLAQAFAPMAHAWITPVSYWRMGDNDPGAVPGAVNSTVDLIRGQTLKLVNQPFFDPTVSPTATARVGSSLSMGFFGGCYGTNAAIPGLTDNFGLELWVRPSAIAPAQCLAYNGETTNNGWGLYITNGAYRGLIGGAGFVGSGTATAGAWTHLALVRDSGTTTLYVNGVPSGTSVAVPNAPAGRFATAARPENVALDQVSVSAYLDGIRVFTFAPGAFSTNDLLLTSGAVFSKADSGSGSLRSAITNLNATGPATINFAVAGTITLLSNLPAISNSVVINGPGTNVLTVSGSNSVRLLQLVANTTNRISGLTLADAFTVSNNAGAALYNLGSTVLQGCALVSNSVVGGFGGAVANFGTGSLWVTNSVFANNAARGGAGPGGPWDSWSGAGGGGAGMGGALYTEGAAVTVSGCSFVGNVAAGGNGGNGGKSSTFNYYTPGSDGGYPNPGAGSSGTGGAGGFGGGGGGAGGLGNGFGGTGGFGGGGGASAGSGTYSEGGPGGTFGGSGGFGFPATFNGGGGGGAGLGAGLFARTGLVSVVNCNFNNNLATNGLGGTGHGYGGNGQGVGGAIFSLDAVLTLAGNSFAGNAASTASANVRESFVVSNTNDSGGGSLRETVNHALLADGPVTITFAPSLSGQTITLTSGELSLSDAISVNASSLPAGLTLSGGGSSRIVYTTPQATVFLAGLTFTGGNGIGPSVPGFGGAVCNYGTLTVSNCTFTGNSAANGGGIMCVNGSMTVVGCTFYSNAVTAAGGGLSSSATSVLVKQCTFFGNTAAGPASGGGAVNATASSASVALDGCTIVGNSASNRGGGIRQAGGTVAITSCIVAGNSAGVAESDLAGSIAILGPNFTFGNPMLAALGNYGGPTRTMPPLPGSPAIDGCTAGTSFATDQRGQPRVLGAFADLGAVEGTFSPVFQLGNYARVAGGGVQFNFTNMSGPIYGVLASTNVAAPLNTWSNLGAAVEAPLRTFTFTDSSATNYPQRFYRIVTP